MSIPDLLYEQVFLGEKTLDDVASSGRGEIRTEDGRHRMEELADSNRAILEAYPADKMKEAFMRKLGESNSQRSEDSPNILSFPKPERTRTFRIAAMAAAACAVLAISLVTVNRQAESAEFTGTGILESATRVKGAGAKLYIYRKEGEKATLLSARSKVRQNDILQLSYVAGGDLYGAIISVDGNGTVTRHFPDTGDAAAPLEQSGEIPLAFSYQLDNAPRFERFILITGQKPFPIDDAASEIGRSVRNGFSPSFDLSVFLPSRTKATDILLIK